MIIVSKPSKPFQYTAKLTPRRHAIVREYEEEIERLYKEVADSSQSNIASPTEWSLPTILKFVREVVNKVLKHNVTDNQDIFQHGCDRFGTSLTTSDIAFKLNNVLPQQSTGHLDQKHAPEGRAQFRRGGHKTPCR